MPAARLDLRTGMRGATGDRARFVRLLAPPLDAAPWTLAFGLSESRPNDARKSAFRWMLASRICSYVLGPGSFCVETGELALSSLVSLSMVMVSPSTASTPPSASLSVLAESAGPAAISSLRALSLLFSLISVPDSTLHSSSALVSAASNDSCSRSSTFSIMSLLS